MEYVVIACYFAVLLGVPILTLAGLVDLLLTYFLPRSHRATAHVERPPQIR